MGGDEVETTGEKDRGSYIVGDSLRVREGVSKEDIEAYFGAGKTADRILASCDELRIRGFVEQLRGTNLREILLQAKDGSCILVSVQRAGTFFEVIL